LADKERLKTLLLKKTKKVSLYTHILICNINKLKAFHNDIQNAYRDTII